MTLQRDAGQSSPSLVGIVNVTVDSFSDGGRHLAPERAIEHALRLLADGADVVELGAASSHPDAAAVSPAEEIRRLAPVLDALLARGARVGVDSCAPAVQRHVAARGVALVNDVRGFSDPSAHGALRDAGCTLVVMHAVRRGGTADRPPREAERVLAGIDAFFEERIAALLAAGISRERLVIDPGMGLFLGDDPEPSLAVLTAIPRLRARFGLPVLVSVSRKSFLGALTGREPAARGPATLAAELFAAAQGVDAIRTHDVAALRDALAVQRALGPAPGAQAVVPMLRIADAVRSRAFYVDGLGFQVDWERRSAPDLPLLLQISRDGLVLQLSQHAGDGQAGALVQLAVPDVDGWSAAMRARGIVPAHPPRDQPWGIRDLRVVDPDGNQLCIGTRLVR